MKTFLYILALTSVISATAQEIEITVVNKDSAAMPYAYVLVNRKPVSITDNQGKALIRKELVMPNDTISVSYLGAAAALAVYDSGMEKTGKCRIVLDETGIMLGEAVVEDIDIEKLFKKSTRNIPQLNYNCIMTADFEASINMPLKGYQITGVVEGENEVWSKKFSYRARGWFHHPLKFTTASDTSGAMKMLNFHTHLALNYILKALEYSRNYMLDHYDPAYSILGETANNRIFRITYPDNTLVGFPFHIILYVDKKTKLITSAEILTVEKLAERNRNPYIIRISCECIVYSHKKPLMNTVYLPVNLHYTFELPGGKVVDVRIKNPVIRKS